MFLSEGSELTVHTLSGIQSVQESQGYIRSVRGRPLFIYEVCTILYLRRLLNFNLRFVFVENNTYLNKLNFV